MSTSYHVEKLSSLLSSNFPLSLQCQKFSYQLLSIFHAISLSEYHTAKNSAPISSRFPAFSVCFSSPNTLKNFHIEKFTSCQTISSRHSLMNIKLLFFFISTFFVWSHSYVNRILKFYREWNSFRDNCQRKKVKCRAKKKEIMKIFFSRWNVFCSKLFIPQVSCLFSRENILQL